MSLLEPPDRGNPLLNAITAPQRATGRLRGLGVTAPPVDVNLQRNMTSLQNKYADMAELLNQLPEPIRNSLINFDARRVAGGAAPMTRQQTALALQTALQNQQATPEPDRNPLNVLGNIRGDLGTILKSIPRLPIAAVNEVRDIANFGEHMQQAQAAGQNPLTALLQAPGVRLVPGTYTLGNVLDGREGLQEVATHPLLAALDVLPLAAKAAAGTRVGQLAEASSVAAGRRPRPLSAVLTSRAVEGADGPLLQRNTLGQAIDTFRNETRVGQALNAFGGARSRATSRMAGELRQRYHSLLLNKGVPQHDFEAFLPRVEQIFDKHADSFPDVESRAQFFEDIQRDPSKYDPALVNEVRDLNYDIAKYHEAQGNLREFDGEWYDVQTAGRLQRARARVDHAQRMTSFRNEYLNPSGQFTPDQFRAALSDITNAPSRRARAQLAKGLQQTLDAYGYDVAALKGVGTDQWMADVNALLDTTPTPRRTRKDIMATLRARRGDRQATLIEAAIAHGRYGDAAKALRAMERRVSGSKLDPFMADDIKSLARRYEFDHEMGAQFSDAVVARRQRVMERVQGQAAPARFHGLLSDEIQRRAPERLSSAAEQILARPLSPEEAARVVTSVERRIWDDVPGVSREETVGIMQQLEREVKATWQELKAAGHDPVFVHRVSPSRANQALSGDIGPVPTVQSSTKQRVLDLTPGVRDVQLSLTHQAGEILQRRYNEMFAEQVMDSFGKTQDQLRTELADAVNWRMGVDPSMDFEGHLQRMIERGWDEFNPDERGYSWGGAKLDKYRGDQKVYIPKDVASNLKRYSQPPSVVSSLIDPITRAFRYNVIGLSPSVIVNNFFSNAVAMTAESGVRPWRHWNAARQWLANPEMIPNEQLKGMILAELPHMEHLDRSAWLSSKTGQRFMAGFNSGKAFQDSVLARTAGSAKEKLDAVVRKSLQAQRWGDNVYRAMQYMDEVERGILKGKTKIEAENAAMELVRRTFVDYTSFTPIERSAMRTIVPFYSYMGHAARFITRYPLDHPLRASVAAQLANAEKERLGAMPGSFLSMVPLPFGLGSMDDDGKKNMLALRPFDPFGDISDLLSVAGWMSATNPLIQTALQQVGVVRGEAELYPTMRYDPETGRMTAVRGNILSDLFHNTVPRAGLVTSVLGLNPAQNELRQRDPGAANRQLVSLAGIPRAWREVDVPREQFQAELSRQRAANDVRNDALRSGNWREALRYPSLRAYFDALQQLPPETLAAMTPAEQQAIAEQLRSTTGP